MFRCSFNYQSTMWTIRKFLILLKLRWTCYQTSQLFDAIILIRNIMCWELEWLHAELRNHLNNAASATAMRELTFSFKWETKNWVTFVTIITIDEDHNDVTTTAKRDRMRITTILMIWNQLSFWVEKLHVKSAKRSNNDV